MKNSLIAAVGVGAAVALVTTAGCGSKSSSAPSSEASSSSKASSSSASSSSEEKNEDYAALLIDASDIESPGDTFTAQAPTLNPNGKPGVATVFSNEGDTREIGDTILVLPSAADAAGASQAAASTLTSAVAGGEPTAAQVGSDSVMISGTSPDGSKAVTVLIFTQGTAFATLEFDSAPGDPVPPEGVVDVGTKQAEKIKSELGG